MKNLNGELGISILGYGPGMSTLSGGLGISTHVPKSKLLRLVQVSKMILNSHSHRSVDPTCPSAASKGLELFPARWSNIVLKQQMHDIRSKTNNEIPEHKICPGL